MESNGTKEAAESVLRELPSVLGAYVTEDAHGQPREVHLLIAAGPKARHFAVDVRTLLEERLGIPIDQRIISIAQVASAQDPTLDMLLAMPDEPGDANAGVAASEPDVPGDLKTQGGAPPRVRFLGAQSDVVGVRVTVTVELEASGALCRGSAVDVETRSGRLRAGARAVLLAAERIAHGRAHFELDSTAVIQAVEREYVLVSTIATSATIGREPLSLAGAQPIEDDASTAAALAALKSVNRLLGRIGRSTEPG